MIDKLFAYGTLMRGFGLTRELAVEADIRYLGRGRFAGRLYDLGPYPAAIEDPSGPCTVWGDVFHLLDPERVLRILDEFEGCDPSMPLSSLYRRCPVDVQFEDGSPVRAWAYLYARPDHLRNDPGAVLIPSGDYRQYVQARGTLRVRGEGPSGARCSPKTGGEVKSPRSEHG